MKCKDVVDFVSALCDGQRIPREAAEHIGQCGDCRARLQDYAILGAELRRAASLQLPGNAPAIEALLSAAEKESMPRARNESRLASWWRKGRRTMKIPRLVFASMLTLILLLSSSLVLVRARTRTGGPVLMLTSRLLRDGWAGDCIITTDGNPKSNECGLTPGVPAGVRLGRMFRFICRDGDRTQLGVKVTYIHSDTFRFVDDFKDVPEKIVWIEPDAKKQIPVSGFGEIELTGEYLDHQPSLPFMPKETLDPGPDELRLVSPLLWRGRQVIIDQGGTVTGTAKDGAVWLYEPGVGRLIISAQNFQGAVKGRNEESRIDFEINRSQYHLLSGAPITRAQEVYVQLDPDYQPSPSEPVGVFGWATLRSLLGGQASDNH